MKETGIRDGKVEIQLNPSATATLDTMGTGEIGRSTERFKQETIYQLSAGKKWPL